MATTRSRPRGREQARPTTGGTTAEHATKIYSAALIGIVVIVAFLALTSVGHVIDAATQHFMLYYAGVFALIGLCASVVLGLVATDRMFLNPGHRVFIQSAHRAASFGAVTFLSIHIVTEILAQRAHVLDAVVPFLSPFRTFYIGLGTIASDLIILLVITGIMRGRFNANGKAWRWRAIHYASYASFVFGVWHGLLAGRPGKPYVDWSYGFLVAVVLLGLAVRVLSNSLRPKESLSAPPVDMTASSASAPFRAAAMFAQLGISRGTPRGGSGFAALRAATGGQPVMSAPLSAPVLTALPPGPAVDHRQPFYEPGYEGPPRYLGAPRATDSGPMPRAGTGPIPRAGTGPMPRAGTGPIPRAGTGPMPRAATGPLPLAGPGPFDRARTGSFDRAGTDAFDRAGTDPFPQVGPDSMRRAGSGPMPRAASGPMHRAASGPMPRAGTGPLPRAATGPIPRPPTGPIPRTPTGPIPRTPTGPIPRTPTGPMPRAGTGPLPRAATGPIPRTPTGPFPRAATGPFPRAATGPFPSAPSGQFPGAAGGQFPGDAGEPWTGPATGPWPGRETGPRPQAFADSPLPPDFGNWTSPDVRAQSLGSGNWEPQGWDDYPPEPAWPRTATGPMQQAEDAMPPWALPGAFGGHPAYGAAPGSFQDAGWYPAEPSWEGGLPEPDPSLKYREPGPGMPGYRGSRDHRYGGDRY